MTTEEGASLGEQLLEAARRNNSELLLTIKSELGNNQEKLADLINSTKEPINQNYALHFAAQFGNWEVIDIILDIEGVEIDPINRDGDTPLHLAVKYANTEIEHGTFIVDGFLDAGSDPRIKDVHSLKPVSYVNKENTKLKELLESAEYAISMEIPEDEQLESAGANAAEGDDGEGSASESESESE